MKTRTRSPWENFVLLCETIKKQAFKITRVGQLVAQEASRRMVIHWNYCSSLAPTPAIGDRVAEILQRLDWSAQVHRDTTAALALSNEPGEKGRGYGIFLCRWFEWRFIPVSEDQGMIDAVQEGALTLKN